MKIVRDPIHGYIEIDERILPIVSSPYFQRLRYITQNALAYMVYPGMRHTRFEHSLGVTHLVKEFLKFLNFNKQVDFIDDDYVLLVSLTGLLHDIGHLAFSHTFESAIKVFDEIYGGKVEYLGNKTHVKLGIKIIEEYLAPYIDKVAKGDPVKFIIHVLNEDPKNEEERLGLQLISNFIDADRGDYLLRDSYYAGVSYGFYDVERLKRVLVYVDGKIAILSKAIPIVEQFLLSRMYMFENVYFHSVVGMYNSILSHAISKLISTGLLDLSNPLEITEFKIFSLLDRIDQHFKNAIIYRQGYKRIKRDIVGECFHLIDREELLNLSRETNSKIIYYEFSDTPYREEKEAVYIYDGNKLTQLSRVSNLINAVKELKKAIIVYHVDMEEKMEKYKRILESCKV